MMAATKKRADSLVRQVLALPDPLADEACKQLMTVKRESRLLDFKQAFDPGDTGDWCELIKDLVAMANTLGGYVIIGANDDGSSSLMSLKITPLVDQAVLVDKIGKYTDVQPGEANLRHYSYRGEERVIFHVAKEDLPIVFTKPGAYQIDAKTQKTAFSAGTIYFRHGSKSEPARQSDIQGSFEKLFTQRRREILTGVRKVVNAPSTHRVAILPKEFRVTDDPSAQAVRVTDDLDAPVVRGLIGRGEYRSVNEELDGVIRGLVTDPEAYAADAQLWRFYERRQGLTATPEALRALLVCSLHRHCPPYYWALHLGLPDATEICKAEVAKDRYPGINVAVRLSYAIGGTNGAAILRSAWKQSRYSSASKLAQRLLALVRRQNRVWAEYGTKTISLYAGDERQVHILDPARPQSIEPLIDLAIEDRRNRPVIKKMDALMYGSLIERVGVAS
jgi:hypothetical protein